VKKQFILDEIRRTAEANDGRPLGRNRFEKETGIREGDWSGRYWARWNDAVTEAGFAPNQMNSAIEDDVLIGQLVLLTRMLGRFPVKMEMRMHKRNDASFPNEKVFDRFGSKADLARVVLAYCSRHGGFEDVVAICSSIAEMSAGSADQVDADELEVGYVYLALMKVGREKRFKIGKADVVGRRTRQIAVELPEELELLHAISTDDAYGIEAYWHRRFAAQRRGGEWFELSAADVKAFKRRKFM
jgi:hypothetical protein